MRNAVGKLLHLGNRFIEQRGSGLHPVLQVLVCPRQLLASLSKSFLSLFTLCDISRNLGCAYDVPRAVSDRRDRQRDIDDRTVFALANRFVMIHLFPSPNPRQNIWFLILLSLRHQKRDRFANDLMRFITEHLLCATIPALDDAIEVLA